MSTSSDPSAEQGAGKPAKVEKESELYIPVRDWLRARGYTVYIEVFDADVVGIKDGHIVCVELKTGLTDSLYRQLSDRARWADEVWGAIPPGSTKPRGEWSAYGFGLLVVKGGNVKEQRQARPQPWHRVKLQTYRRKVLSLKRPALDHHVAGIPTCKLTADQRHESLKTDAEALVELKGFSK